MPVCEVQQTKSSFLKNQNLIKISLACPTPGSKLRPQVKYSQWPIQTSIGRGTGWCSFSISPTFLLIFVTTESTQCFRERFRSIRTPRYFGSTLDSRRVYLFFSLSNMQSFVSKSRLVRMENYKFGYINVKSLFFACQPVIKVLQHIVDYCLKIFQSFVRIENVSVVCKEQKPKFIRAPVDIIDIEQEKQWSKN